MTTIIGLEYKDSAIIVADSQTTDSGGYIYNHPDVKKIAERGSFLIAGSGEVLPCDVAQHIWEPPVPTRKDYKDLFHFMVSKVMPSLRKCLADNGYNFDEDTKEQRFQFIVAVGGEIFDIDQECSVSKSEHNVYAAGSGAPFALGALHAGADAYEAMEIAAKLTAYTRKPYYSRVQPKHIKQEEQWHKVDFAQAHRRITLPTSLLQVGLDNQVNHNVTFQVCHTVKDRL